MPASTQLVRIAALVALGASSAGCRHETARVEPSIQFTTIPPAAGGGSEHVAPIAGRATGIQPGQRIVIYTKAGVWWVQPFTSRPFTSVGADSTWQNTIHLGDETQGDFLRTDCLTGTRDRAVAEPFSVHALNHVEHAPVLFGFALRQQVQVRNFRGHKQHG